MYMNNTYRKKLLNAIIYFSGNVKKPSRTKIFKLLYFLDFKHFKETGKSVTNLDYYVFERGPVPKSFYEEVKSDQLPEDFQEGLKLVHFRSETTQKVGAIFKPRVSPDLSVFSPREQRILKQIALIYLDVDAEMISDISHLKNHPWDKTLETKGLNARIDYKLAIDEDSKISPEEAEQSIHEAEEMLRAFPLLPRL